VSQRSMHAKGRVHEEAISLEKRKEKKRKEKKRIEYAFWRQFNEKPSVIPGCPGVGL